MSKDTSKHLQTKATLTVAVQNENNIICMGMVDLCDKAEPILNSNAPSKR